MKIGLNIFLFFVLIFPIVANGQGNMNIIKHDSSKNIDTIIVTNNNVKITHYHLVSEEIQNIILHDSNESIVLNNDVNNFSRLIYSSPSYSFNIPSLLLTNLVYLENQGLIIGLSRFTINNHHIVIYDTTGLLLAKRSLTAFGLDLNGQKIRRLLYSYPKVKECIPDMVVFKEDTVYHIESSACLFYNIGIQNIVANHWLTLNYLFPLMSSEALEYGTAYSRYLYSFLESDPVDSVIMKNGRPQTLILNSEKGKKVRVPLVSNCDLRKM